MPFVNIKTPEGALSKVQKEEIVHRTTAMLVEYFSEAARPHTMVLIEEVKDGGYARADMVYTIPDAYRAVDLWRWRILTICRGIAPTARFPSLSCPVPLFGVRALADQSRDQVWLLQRTASTQPFIFSELPETVPEPEYVLSVSGSVISPE